MHFYGLLAFMNAQSGKGIMTFEEKQAKFEKLLLAYSHYFDIERFDKNDGGDFSAVAQYHSRSEKYVLVKKARLWAMEQNEYVYFAVAENINTAELNRLYEAARDSGLEQIHPHSEHMYSYVTLIVLADNIDDEAKKAIKKLRYQKNFRLSLHGWMEFRIAAVSFSDGEILSNARGKAVKDILLQNLQPK